MRVEHGLPAAHRGGRDRLDHRGVVVAGEGGQVEGGLLGGDHAEGLGLADLEVVGVAERLELGGLVEHEVVEGGQVEGVAGDVEVAGAVELAGGGVAQGDVPALAALLLPLLEELGVVLGDRHRDRGLDRGEPARGQARGELVVHVRGGGLGQGVGGLGDLAGLPRLHGQGLDEPPDLAGAGAGGRGRRRSASSRSAWTPRGRRRPAPGRTRRPPGCPPRPGTRPDAARRGGRRRPRWRRRCRRSRGAARTTARPAAACRAPRRGRRACAARAGQAARRGRGPRPPPASRRIVFEHVSIVQRAAAGVAGCERFVAHRFSRNFDRRTRRDREPPAGVSTRSLALATRPAKAHLDQREPASRAATATHGVPVPVAAKDRNHRRAAGRRRGSRGSAPARLAPRPPGLARASTRAARSRHARWRSLLDQRRRTSTIEKARPPERPCVELARPQTRERGPLPRHPSGQPAAATARAGGRRAARRRADRLPDRLGLRARLPARQPGRPGPDPADPRARREAPLHADVQRLRPARAVRARRQRGVPRDQGGDARGRTRSSCPPPARCRGG